MMKKRIAILGSTGSVGENAVKVAKAMGDAVQVTVLAAGSNAKRLAEQAAELGATLAVVHDESRGEELRKLTPGGIQTAAGAKAICDAVTRPDVDLVLVAIVGTAGLFPVISAIKAHKTIALASKEVMVMAGRLVTKLADQEQVDIIPVDSEHSAIFQCLEGRAPDTVRTLWLTASGGPLRQASMEQIAATTWEQAMKHPTWSMGPKVTIDSASLMNKALEILEARWLFRVQPEKIDVLIHPQSIVHSMVQFIDGAWLAHLSMPDMRFPIQYAFTWPQRMNTGLPELDLPSLASLSFEKPDKSRFPSLDFAYHALRTGKTMPAVMNAANEIAVDRFRQGHISFPAIWKIVEKTMNAHECLADSDLDAILAADSWARNYAAEITF